MIFDVKNYGIKENTIQTKEIQRLINTIYQLGGGTLLFNKGTYITGALFFKKGVNLYIKKEARILGNTDIGDYPKLETRIEGQTRVYTSALINVNKSDHFKLFGGGTIDGRGKTTWKAFWENLEKNPNFKNIDLSRPRILYVSNSRHVKIKNITFKDSHFWTTHFYRCTNLLIKKCHFSSSFEDILAPSSDGIDLDVCENVLIKQCSFNVNDDAIAIKGGKGENAWQDSNNGFNKNIVITKCYFDYCHACLTLGSETLKNHNIILKNSMTKRALKVLNLKMRTDTHQENKKIIVKNIKGFAENLLTIKSWSQYHTLSNQSKLDKSIIENIYLKHLSVETKNKCDIENSDLFEIKNISIQ